MEIKINIHTNTKINGSGQKCPLHIHQRRPMVIGRSAV